MLLDDKSHTTEKPAYFPLNVDTFGRKMHLWLVQQMWVCSMCPWILAKSGLRWQALNRKLMSGFQACLPGSVNRTINGPHSQILPAHTSLFCSYHSESSWIRIDLNTQECLRRKPEKPTFQSGSARVMTVYKKEAWAEVIEALNIISPKTLTETQIKNKKQEKFGH